MIQDILFTGYEIARLISYNAIKEGTYLHQYIDGEKCKTDGIYIIHNRAIYSLKLWIDELGLELLPFEEMGVSLLCDEGIEFKIIEDELEKPIFRRDTKLKDEFISNCNKVVKIEKIHYCEQCGIPFLDEKIREKYHGCCSSECEKQVIIDFYISNIGYYPIIQEEDVSFLKEVVDEANEIIQIKNHIEKLYDKRKIETNLEIKKVINDEILYYETLLEKDYK